MNPHQIISHVRNLKSTIVAAVLLAAFVAVCAVGIVSSTAQSTQEQKEERKFENTIPAHVPIKVKVKNEQSFKNLKNKKWARELEIEVKNTGSKPIYFMYMLMIMPDVTVGGHPYALQVTYGRKKLVRLDTPVQPEDVPILPGESVTLRVSEPQLKGYEELRDEENRDDPKKIRFDFQLINFGDGTGLSGTDGSPTPEPARKQSSNAPYKEGKPPGRPPTCGVAGGADAPTKFLNPVYSLIPAKISRVNLSLPDETITSSATSALPDLCGCQNVFNCFRGKIEFATCPCDDPEQFTAFVPTACAHPFGSCTFTRTVTQTCNTKYNGTQYCQYQDEVSGCGGTISTPTPTPTATPTPTPTPSPECDPDTRPNSTNCSCETNFPPANVA